MTRRYRFQLLTALVVAGAIAAGGVMIEHVGGPWQAAQKIDGGQHSEFGFDDLFRSGVGHLVNDDPAAAVAAFEKALILRPDVVEARVNLGYALLGVSMNAAAEKAFRTAIEQRPQQVNAYFGLAESLETQNDLDGALGAMRTYLHLAAPDDPYRRRAMAAIWEWEAARNGLPAVDLTVENDDRSHEAANEPGGSPLRLVTSLPAIDPDRAVASHDQGSKVVILNVWATWCAPCRRELPLLQAMSDRLDSARAGVIGLSIDEDFDLVREFLVDLGVRYPNYVDSENRVAAGILDVRTYPQTLILGGDGRILHRFVGAETPDGQNVVDTIEALVGRLTAESDGSIATADRS